MKQIQVVFVCLGNICRSPTAEAVMNTVIAKADLQEKIICDSAGTSGNHQGEEADPRSITHAKKRGHNVTSISRQFLNDDLKKFDYIVVMDNDNYVDVMELDPQKKFAKKIFKMTQFCTAKPCKIVPDPYYEGPEGFELVIDILEDACEGLLNKIKVDHKI